MWFHFEQFFPIHIKFELFVCVCKWKLHNVPVFGNSFWATSCVPSMNSHIFICCCCFIAHTIIAVLFVIYRTSMKTKCFLGIYYFLIYFLSAHWWNAQHHSYKYEYLLDIHAIRNIESKAKWLFGLHYY